MEKINQLEVLVADAKKNGADFHEKGNKAAGTRLRKNAMDIKLLCDSIRKEVSNIKNK